VTREVEYRKYHSPEVSLLNQTKRLLRRSGLKARKSLGQHFLIDEGVLRTIASAAELNASDVVVEIGPGLGILTRELARRAGRVVSVELDSLLAASLKQALASLKNVTVVDGDILRLEPAALLRDQKTANNYKVVANLPYYITSAILRHFLEAKLKPEGMVVMVQKEVAEAIVAKPGRMSLLSVSVQFYGEPRIISYVPARCFYPLPEVSSAILKVVLRPQPMVTHDSEGFFQLVRAGFCASRKQLANSLAQGLGLPKAAVLLLLEKAAIISKRRAETLTITEWAQLWQAYKQVRD